MKKTKSNFTRRRSRRIVICSAVGFLLIGLVVVFVRITPFYLQLKSAQDNQLVFAVKNRKQTVDQLLSRKKSVAAQISSRTKARQKLEEHNAGGVSRQVTAEFLAPILSDALDRSNEVEFGFYHFEFVVIFFVYFYIVFRIRFNVIRDNGIHYLNSKVFGK